MTMSQLTIEQPVNVKTEAAPQPTMTAATLDIEAYFKRIGYAGERVVSLDVLEAIIRHHTQTVPFENLNPLLRWPVRLDLASVQQKLVREGRGGYCFEQNLMLSHVLQALGFQVTHLAGRVVWNALPGVIQPRSHMVLRIDLDGKPYIVDVGFGGLTLTSALRLEPEVEQSTRHEPFRLSRADDLLIMQAKLGGKWQSLYHFDLQKQQLIDYEVSSWYICTHPNSHFLTNLMVARTDPEQRYGLRNNELSVHHVGGITERRTLSSVADFRTALETVFRLTLPDTPDLDPVLQQFLKKRL